MQEYLGYTVIYTGREQAIFPFKKQGVNIIVITYKPTSIKFRHCCVADLYSLTFVDNLPFSFFQP